MCFFQLVKFENYTSEPRIKPAYFLAGETVKAYRRRQRTLQREEAAANIAQNATGRTYPRVIGNGMLKVAEDEKPVYEACSSFYVPCYRDILILFVRGYYKMHDFRSGIHGDHWELFGWSDREEHIRERLVEQGLKKVGEWGMADEPEIVGYYREA